jgi:putative peptidoglycan lipid II flippase
MKDAPSKAAGTGESEASISNRAVSRSAFKVMLGGLFSLLAGLANQAVVAALFGAGAYMDAYLTALVVPTYLQAVLLSGLPFVFIPAFVRAEEGKGEEEAWSLVGTFFWLIAGVFAVVAVGGALLAPWIIALSAPGLSPEKADLSARMLTILMFAVPLSGLRTLTRGIQNARNRFFLPAMAGALSSAVNLAVLLILYQALGPLALAWGYLVAEGARAIVTVVPVLRHGWDKMMPLTDRRLREMLQLMVPFLLLGLVTRSMTLFERYFASGLPDGDLSYLGYAGRLPQMIMILFGSGITTAIFPAMARAYMRNGQEGLVERLEYGLRLNSAVALPAWAIVSAVAVPLITVVFERGAFTRADTLNVSRIVPIVMLGAVVCPMVGNVLTRTFYVTKDTRTAPIVSTAASALYILLASVLVVASGYVGLAVAVPLHRILAIVVLFVLLMRTLGPLRGTKVPKYVLGYAALSFMAYLGARLASEAVAFLPALVQLLVGAAVAGLLYIAILFWTDRVIAESILEMLGIQRLIYGAKLGFSRIAQATRG